MSLSFSMFENDDTLGRMPLACLADDPLCNSAGGSSAWLPDPVDIENYQTWGGGPPPIGVHFPSHDGQPAIVREPAEQTPRRLTSGTSQATQSNEDQVTPEENDLTNVVVGAAIILGLVILLK